MTRDGLFPAKPYAIVCLLWTAIPAFAGEYAVFVSGMTMHVDRHETSGEVVRLFRGDTVTELPLAALTGFEPDELPAEPRTPSETGVTPSSEAVPPAPQAPAPPAPTPDLRVLVREAAAKAGLPAAFVESVAKTESGFDPSAISPKGAIGVMQLMPATAKALGVEPADPKQNIEAGALLLRQLLIKYDGDVVKALSAYNAGEGAVDRYRGEPPYPETQHYVNTVVRDYLKNGQ